MRYARCLAIAAAGMLAASAGASTAAPIAVNAAHSARMNLGEASNIQNVRWRGRGHHHPRYGYGYHRRGYGWGPAVGGLAAGAIIGGAIANSNARAAERTDAYCSQKYRSYDPSSGTYLGYDGERHPCP